MAKEQKMSWYTAIETNDNGDVLRELAQFSSKSEAIEFIVEYRLSHPSKDIALIYCVEVTV